MTKLTQQEIEQEQFKFDQWFIYNFSESERLDKICSIHKVLQRDIKGRYWDESINIAYKAWLARAELAKGNKVLKKAPSYQELQRRKFLRMIGKSDD